MNVNTRYLRYTFFTTQDRGERRWNMFLCYHTWRFYSIMRPLTFWKHSTCAVWSRSCTLHFSFCHSLAETYWLAFHDYFRFGAIISWGLTFRLCYPSSRFCYSSSGASTYWSWTSCSPLISRGRLLYHKNNDSPSDLEIPMCPSYKITDRFRFWPNWD